MNVCGHRTSHSTDACTLLLSELPYVPDLGVIVCDNETLAQSSPDHQAGHVAQHNGLGECLSLSCEDPVQKGVAHVAVCFREVGQFRR